jgi:uncharacterized membrane protein
MTNEEIIEELLHKAHNKGFYNKMMEQVLSYKINDPNPNQKSYDHFILAYMKCNEENDKQKIKNL